MFVLKGEGVAYGYFHIHLWVKCLDEWVKEEGSTFSFFTAFLFIPSPIPHLFPFLQQISKEHNNKRASKENRLAELEVSAKDIFTRQGSVCRATQYVPWQSAAKMLVETTE